VNQSPCRTSWIQKKIKTPSSKKGPSSKQDTPQNCNISPQNVLALGAACRSCRDQGCIIQVKKIPPKKHPVKASAEAGMIFTSTHTSQQVPLNIGRVGVCLLPQNRTGPVCLGMYGTGLNFVPSHPTPSHQGCGMDSPHEHQKYVCPASTLSL